MNDEVILTYEEEPTVELEYVEAAIKPETVGHVIPTYESQTVYPASGTVYSGLMIEQEQTGNRYVEAIDIFPTEYTYRETDEPIPSELEEQEVENNG